MRLLWLMLQMMFWIMVVIAIIGAPYFAAAFATWDLHPWHWSPWLRGSWFLFQLIWVCVCLREVATD